MRMNILISSAGRRVALANCFRETLVELGIDGRLIAVDASPYSPAGQLADAFYVVPRCTADDFLAEVREVCEREDVSLVVPTIDTELPIYAYAKADFERRGIRVAVSAPETIAICSDKVRTHAWLTQQGFPAPRQSTPQAVLRSPDGWHLPLIVKPKTGSASVGVRVISSLEELHAASRGSEPLIVQEVAPGAEHTVNVFVNRHGRCVCTVPHLRMEIRGGEVSKGKTVKDPRLMALMRAVAESLPGAYGALNVQCFVAPSGEIRIIEMNARFGGGYPLSHRAGAHITTWLVEDVLGLESPAPFDDWQSGVVMLRYDEAVFLERDNVAPESHAKSVHRVRS